MAAVIMTPPLAQFFDDNGDPLALGKVYFYVAGDVTPKDTYTTAAGNVANANPVVLDADGRASIWLSTTGSYKVIVKDADGVQVGETVDNLAAFKTGTSDVFSDSTFYLQDNSDATKQLQFQLSGITTGTTTTVTIPNGNTTMVGTDLTQTLSNKTHRATTITGNSDAVQLRVTGNATQTNYLAVFEQSGGGDLFRIGQGGQTEVIGDLLIDAFSDGTTLRVQGHSTQTNPILTIEKSDGTDLFTVANSGNATLTGYLTAARVTSQATPADPTGTADTTGKMMGLAGSITPQGTGKIMITISGSMTQSTNTDGGKVQIRYGTGSAPANADALTGTAVGNIVSLNMTTAASARLGWSCNAIVTGLTPATAYWLDVGLAAVTGGTASIKDVSISAFEL